MATSKQSNISQERLEEITQCPICLKTTDIPRSLPCLHAFCHKCLQEYCRDLNHRDSIVCPLCRSNHSYPENGVSGFPRNFFIQYLIDVYNEKRGTTECRRSVTCEACENVDAARYCVDCNQNFCRGCSVLHRRMRLGGAHKVVSLKESKNTELVRQRGSYCENDPKELVKMYCTECHTNICFVCNAFQHQQHKCLMIDEAAARFRQRINYDVQVIEGQTRKVNEKERKLNSEKTKLRNNVKALEKAIQQKGEEMKKAIDASVSELLEELNAIKRNEDKQLSSLASELETVMVSMESYCVYATELQSKGRPADITKVGRQLHNRATALSQVDLSCYKYQLPKIVFTPTVLPGNLIGSIGHSRVNLNSVAAATGRKSPAMSAVSHHTSDYRRAEDTPVRQRRPRSARKIVPDCQSSLPLDRTSSWVNRSSEYSSNTPDAGRTSHSYALADTHKAGKSASGHNIYRDVTKSPAASSSYVPRDLPASRYDSSSRAESSRSSSVDSRHAQTRKSRSRSRTRSKSVHK